jgi:hypothetical protein
VLSVTTVTNVTIVTNMSICPTCSKDEHHDGQIHGQNLRMLISPKCISMPSEDQRTRAGICKDNIVLFALISVEIRDIYKDSGYDWVPSRRFRILDYPKISLTRTLNLNLCLEF